MRANGIFNQTIYSHGVTDLKIYLSAERETPFNLNEAFDMIVRSELNLEVKKLFDENECFMFCGIYKKDSTVDGFWTLIRNQITLKNGDSINFTEKSDPSYPNRRMYTAQYISDRVGMERGVVALIAKEDIFFCNREHVLAFCPLGKIGETEGIYLFLAVIKIKNIDRMNASGACK